MHTTLGGLTSRIVPESPAGQPAAAIILSHGFGAPGDDLVPLHAELLRLRPALARCRFIFPEAPLSLAALGYGGDARAWWLIDFEQVQQLQQGDPLALREFRKIEPEGMAKARAAMLKLVSDVSAQTGLPLGRIVLGGFSQGAMLSTDVALRLEEAPLGLVILSGTLLLEDVWRTKARARAGLKVLQSHGTLDPLLPFAAAGWLNQLLTEAGLDVDFVTFRGGHGIPLEALEKLASFLDARVHDTSGGSGSKIPT
jgi:phospholipase/carboxylesterase